MEPKPKVPSTGPHRFRLRATLAIGLASALALAAPVAAYASESVFANNKALIQHEVASSAKYSSVKGGFVQIALAGAGWYGIQHGRSVGANGNLGGTYSAPNVKVYWTNPQQSDVRGDCWWTWTTYDGLTGRAYCAVVRA